MVGGTTWELKIKRQRLQEKEKNDGKEGGQRTNEKNTQIGQRQRPTATFFTRKKMFRACQKIFRGENGGMRGAAGEDYRRGQGDKMIIN